MSGRLLYYYFRIYSRLDRICIEHSSPRESRIVRQKGFRNETVTNGTAAGASLFRTSVKIDLQAINIVR